MDTFESGGIDNDVSQMITFEAAAILAETRIN